MGELIVHHPPVTDTFARAVAELPLVKKAGITLDDLLPLDLDARWAEIMPHALVVHRKNTGKKTGTLAYAYTGSGQQAPNGFSLVQYDENDTVSIGKVSMSRVHFAECLRQICQGSTDYKNRKGVHFSSVSNPTIAWHNFFGENIEPWKTPAAAGSKGNTYERTRAYGGHYVSHQLLKAFGQRSGRRSLFPQMRDGKIRRELAAATEAIEAERKGYLNSLFVRGCFDADVVEYLTAENLRDLSLHHWLAGQGDAENGKRRLQATKAMPNLRDMLRAGKHTELIDAGRSIYEVAGLAVSGNGTPAPRPITRFLGASPLVGGQLTLNGTKQAATALQGVNPNQYPSTHAEYTHMNGVTEALVALSRITGRDAPTTIADVYQAHRKEPTPWSAAFQCVQAYGLPAHADFVRDWQHQVLFQVSTAAVYQRAAAYGITQADRYAHSLTNMLLKHTPTLPLLETAITRWHEPERLNAFTNQMAGVGIQDIAGPEDISATGDWLALSKAAFIKQSGNNGYFVTPITRDAHLRLLGKVNGHCVGSYGYACRAFGSHILMLAAKELLPELPTDADPEAITQAMQAFLVSEAQNADTTRANGKEYVGVPHVSTAYVSFEHDVSTKTREARLGQHAGWSNRPAKEEERKALDNYLNLILTDKYYTPDWDGIEMQLDYWQNVGELSRMRSRLRFDPNNGPDRQQVFEICRPYLPNNKWRNARDLDHFWALAKATDLLELT